MSRVLTDFADRQWVVRDGPTYELTPLGEFVADRFLELRDAMAIERKLRDVWQWLPGRWRGSPSSSSPTRWSPIPGRATRTSRSND